MKTFNITRNIGTAKYVVNFHDGESTHRDGSRFYDLKTFSNKKKLNAFTKELKLNGYVA